MQRLLSGLLLFAVSAPLFAQQQVVDDFESGTNPNGWSWLSGSPGGLVLNGVIQSSGGNPGAWFDSTTPYFAGHPNFTALPAAGTPLRAALDSGTLTSASVDIQRLDTSAVQNCHPVYDLASAYQLELLDLHTLATDPPTPIEAHTIEGPASPAGTSYPWTSASFTIPSGATDVPPGWVLDVPPEVTYTWADLMHNIDAISFYAIDPGEITFDSCWRLGADNVVITYGGGDAIFADGFELATSR
jgi:hypothetical protein